jgi:hypothetical protein
VFNCFAISAYSQNAGLTLHVKKPDLKGVITEIKNQTEFDFLYNKDIEPLFKGNIAINVDNGTIEDVLNQLFKKSKIQYQIVNKTIVLTPLAPTPISEEE